MMGSHSHNPLCPYCGSEDSRTIDKRGIWRRRECLNPDCNERFSSDEVVRKPWQLRTPKIRPKHLLRQPGLL